MHKWILHIFFRIFNFLSLLSLDTRRHHIDDPIESKKNKQRLYALYLKSKSQWKKNTIFRVFFQPTKRYYYHIKPHVQ